MKRYGKIYALLDPPSCGRTTLLNCVLGNCIYIKKKILKSLIRMSNKLLSFKTQVKDNYVSISNCIYR